MLLCLSISSYSFHTRLHLRFRHLLHNRRFLFEVARRVVHENLQTVLTLLKVFQVDVVDLLVLDQSRRQVLLQNLQILVEVALPGILLVLIDVDVDVLRGLVVLLIDSVNFDGFE